jgi:hypothetical protein
VKHYVSSFFVELKLLIYFIVPMLIFVLALQVLAVLASKSYFGGLLFIYLSMKILCLQVATFVPS